MGMFTDLSKAYVLGKIIEVDAVAKWGGGAVYRLIIDNQKMDEVEGFAGTFCLRGKIEASSRTRNVTVTIKQSLIFGTKYKLEIDGQEYAFERIR